MFGVILVVFGWVVLLLRTTVLVVASQMMILYDCVDESTFVTSVNEHLVGVRSQVGSVE